jgi:NADH-quinone oxidoreductase subunit A
MTDLVFYLVVFLAIGVFFLFIHLLIGKFVRPYRPDAEKLTIYECGEPTVGSAWIQFDLRYYVVALLFVVFDVEVAFFFPWAVVFGKANELAKPDSALTSERDRQTITQELVPARLNLVYLETEPAPAKKKQAGKSKAEPKGAAKKGQVDVGKIMAEAKAASEAAAKGAPPPDVEPIDSKTAQTWAWIAFFDILVFFGVLMVGFAYLWKRGDIDWVRSTAAETEPPPVV